ncbi:MAG: GNAT family N-acetyltransferase [Thermoproteus sp.]
MVEVGTEGLAIRSGRELLDLALDILDRGYGRALKYARAVVLDGIGDVAVAFLAGRPVAAEVFYRIRLAAPLCVHYYVAVLEGYRGRGLGKALVRAVEGLCGADAYAATTTEGNRAARALFASLGYRGYSWDELEPDIRDVLLKATCGYDDDMIYIKGLPPSALAASRGEADAFNLKECYLVWLGRRRF